MKIIDTKDGEAIAVYSSKRGEWLDPFGGMFDAAAQSELSAFAAGKVDAVVGVEAPRLIVAI